MLRFFVVCIVVAPLTLAAVSVGLDLDGASRRVEAAEDAASGDTATTPNLANVDNAEPAAVPVPKASPKALEYYQGNNILWVAYQILALFVPALLLFTGWSARLRNAAQSIGREWIFMVAIYFLLYAGIRFLIELPLDYYVGYVRSHAYGMSNQTLTKWFGDSLKRLMVTMVAGGLLLWIPYLLLAKSPRRWWLYAGMLAVPFMFLVMLITPIWIQPLFNDFGPMRDKQLEAKILALANRAGIEGGRVFEVNKSVDTKAMNAYVAGFLSTKRIVLWDTLLKELDDKEVLFVMGHEMGHYVLGHVVQTILFISALLFVALFAVSRLATWLMRRYQRRFGFDRLSDVASLPLLLMVGNLVALVLSPAALAYSRHNEHEADRFALELLHDNHAAATAFVKFQKLNLGNPNPGLMYTFWRATHPSIAERIEFFNTYRPWAHGQPSRYGALFEVAPP